MITVESETKYAQRIVAGKHTFGADEPVDHGGTDTGPAPYDLLLGALGACTSITLRMYAERKGWDLGRIHVELRFHRDPDGKEHITREVQLGATLTDEQRQKLAEICDKTPVTRTVKQGAQIQTSLR